MVELLEDDDSLVRIDVELLEEELLAGDPELEASELSFEVGHVLKGPGGISSEVLAEKKQGTELNPNSTKTSKGPARLKTFMINIDGAS